MIQIEYMCSHTSLRLIQTSYSQAAHALPHICKLVSSLLGMACYRSSLHLHARGVLYMSPLICHPFWLAK